MIRTLIAAFGILLLAQSAHAQARPGFFFGGATAFTPEISIVSTGVINDVQATVSADRKYVTLNMRPQNSTLLALRSYTFQTGGTNGGFVGGPGAMPRNGVGAGGAVQGVRGGGADGASSAVRTSPSDILEHAKSQASVLYQSGMTRVSKLNE